MTRNLIYILFMAFALHSGCQKRADNTAEEPHVHEEDEHAEGENTVSLSPVQVASAGIQTGKIDSLPMSGFVKANGTLDLPPQNVATISAPVAGFVKKVNFLVGNYVKRGAVLAILEHQDYLKIQEEYLTLVSRSAFLKADWERQKMLDSANIAAKKRFQEAESEFKTNTARLKSLEKQLQYIGLDPAAIRNGELRSSIYIRAPFSGYITMLNTHNGMFVQPEQALYEMINPEHMHIELNIFEKDIAKLKEGQGIRFTVPSMGKKEYKGEVFLVGRSFDPKNKTVKVHGHIHGDPKEFLRGLYVEATIFTGQEKVPALPEEAFIREEGQEYIFIRQDEHASAEHSHDAGEDDHHHDEISFRRIPITTGISKGGMKEIKNMDSLPGNAHIVLKGAYDLFAEMKKGEGGHHHH